MHQRLSRLYEWILLPLIRHRALGWLFLITIVVAWFACVTMFYTKAVVVKILPLDNKAQFNVVVDMPSGTALPITANVAKSLVEALRADIPEITALQSYVGVASPFDFNGMVRHYYLRQEPWQANIEVQLLDKHERERTNHEIAVAARDLLTPIARNLGARNITVVEMPPGPPVLQSVVAEVYGPTDDVRRQVPRDLTGVFRQVPFVGDVDNYMLDPYEVLRFEVDTEKAVRRGISTDTINRNVGMAMGGHKLGDVKQGKPLEPIFVVLQVPLQERSQLGRLLDLPVPAAAEIPVIPQALTARTVPLAELGRFIREPVDPVIYHKDLRPVEYVVGDVVAWPGAPIYAMFGIEDRLADYTTPDGVEGPSGSYFGPPTQFDKSAFEWTGEWTVTFETFRDMGIAFMVALFFIYMLIVGEFENFTLPAIIMAPIPLTLLGIIPGHWMLNAAFTATSMIGFIALAGIIVRNSILLVDFARIEVERGVDVRHAVVMACEARTRPIMITAFALVLGSSVILTDPIFQGLAVSLLFGVLVSTVLTLIVIPLGCISGHKAFEGPAAEGGPEAPPTQAEGGPEAPPTQAEGEPAMQASAATAGKKSKGVLHFARRIVVGLLAFMGMILVQVWRLALAPVLRLLGRLLSPRPKPTATGPQEQGPSASAVVPPQVATAEEPSTTSPEGEEQPAAMVGEPSGDTPPPVAEPETPRQVAAADISPETASEQESPDDAEPHAHADPEAPPAGGSKQAVGRSGAVSRERAGRRRGIRLKSDMRDQDKPA